MNLQKTAFFRFKKLLRNYLIINDIGEYVFLSAEDFNIFISGKLKQIDLEKYKELRDKNFIRSHINMDTFAQRYAVKNLFLSRGASLHIVVITLRCNHSCIYCQASAQQLSAKHFDMNEKIAEKTVDRILESSSKNITIEFQGGEPLANFKIIKFIFNYAQNRNKEIKKNLRYTLVSNLNLMNKNILGFLIRNNFSICTSLDGPGHIHNKHRISLQKVNSYENTIYWLKKIKEISEKHPNNGKPYTHKPSAILTVTKFSLPYTKEIVDEYIKAGIRHIHLRPVTPFGISHNYNLWKSLSFSAEKFIVFYKKALDYIIELNLNGTFFSERFATIFLAKILTAQDPDYLDIRSPCGAGIGQIAYNFNGDVYTCDEGRMFSRRGDESFRIGNVIKNSYPEFMNSETIKTMCSASCLDDLPECSECAYKLYCGVCPIFNHFVNGNIFNKALFLCKIHKGILDYLFIKLQTKTNKDVFQKWVLGNEK